MKRDQERIDATVIGMSTPEMLSVAESWVLLSDADRAAVLIGMAEKYLGRSLTTEEIEAAP